MLCFIGHIFCYVMVNIIYVVYAFSVQLQNVLAFADSSQPLLLPSHPKLNFGSLQLGTNIKNNAVSSNGLPDRICAFEVLLQKLSASGFDCNNANKLFLCSCGYVPKSNFWKHQSLCVRKVGRHSFFFFQENVKRGRDGEKSWVVALAIKFVCLDKGFPTCGTRRSSRWYASNFHFSQKPGFTDF